MSGFSPLLAATWTYSSPCSASTRCEKFRKFGACLPSFAGLPGTAELRAQTKTQASQTRTLSGARTLFWPTKLAPIQSSR